MRGPRIRVRMQAVVHMHCAQSSCSGIGRRSKGVQHGGRIESAAEADDELRFRQRQQSPIQRFGTGRSVVERLSPCGRGVGERGGSRLLQNAKNRLQHGLGVFQDIVIPESQDPETLRHKPSIALRVT
jgi:hypothetical protein